MTTMRPRPKHRRQAPSGLRPSKHSLSLSDIEMRIRRESPVATSVVTEVVGHTGSAVRFKARLHGLYARPWIGEGTTKREALLGLLDAVRFGRDGHISPYSFWFEPKHADLESRSPLWYPGAHAKHLNDTPADCA